MTLSVLSVELSHYLPESSRVAQTFIILYSLGCQECCVYMLKLLKFGSSFLAYTTSFFPSDIESLEITARILSEQLVLLIEHKCMWCNTAQYTCIVFILMLVAANNASRTNKCMRESAELISTKWLREEVSAKVEKGKEKKLFAKPRLSLSSLGSSSIPEIGQKSNRVVDVNGNVGGIDPGRRGIQQICSLTSRLARSNGRKEGEENPDDTMEQKNLPNYVYLSPPCREIDFLEFLKLT